MIGAALALVGCTSGREARPVERPSPPSTSEPSAESTEPDGTDGESDDTTATTERGGTSSSSSTSSTSTTVTAEFKGTAVAGSAGGVEASGPPFAQTDPFSEAVRLSDGTCVGWPEGQGGSTAGLAVGAPVIVLDAVADQELGRGSITASRWEDMSAGGEQWNCMFDFTAAVSGAPPEVRIKVANLSPWTARPDPSNPLVRRVREHRRGHRPDRLVPGGAGATEHRRWDDDSDGGDDGFGPDRLGVERRWPVLVPRRRRPVCGRASGDGCRPPVPPGRRRQRVHRRRRRLRRPDGRLCQRITSATRHRADRLDRDRPALRLSARLASHPLCVRCPRGPRATDARCTP